MSSAQFKNSLYIWSDLWNIVNNFEMKLLWMFINKIEEAREFLDFTSIYIVDPMLMKFCVVEGNFFISNKF